jgi:hypothetical protein
MGFRFRKSVRLGKGVRLNLGKRGASVSVGNRWLGATVGSRGVSKRVSLPGSGLSYTSAARSGCLVPMLVVVVLATVGLAR